MLYSRCGGRDGGLLEEAWLHVYTNSYLYSYSSTQVVLVLGMKTKSTRTQVLDNVFFFRVLENANEIIIYYYHNNDNNKLFAVR